MINQRHLAVVVMRAMVVVCLVASSYHAASAAPRARSANAAAVEPAAPPPAPEPTGPPRARAYLFRGAMGPIFSRGMDKLTDRLQQVGIDADINEFTICRIIAAKAARQYKEDPAPIILIGHSMGGLCSIIFAGILGEENIPVSLIVAVDPAHATGKVPLNVERFINIYLSDSVLGGGDVVAEPGYQGHYASYDLKDHSEVNHINIDKMDSIHDQLVNMVLQIATTPMQTNVEKLPLRYLVPPDQPVELWDSGMPLIARAGDTMRRLAELNHVPLWALSQANNQWPAEAPLVPGQRVVIPRHLVPMPQTPPPAAPATAAAAKR